MPEGIYQIKPCFALQKTEKDFNKGEFFGSQMALICTERYFFYLVMRTSVKSVCKKENVVLKGKENQWF